MPSAQVKLYKVSIDDRQNRRRGTLDSTFQVSGDTVDQRLTAARDQAKRRLGGLPSVSATNSDATRISATVTVG